MPNKLFSDLNSDYLVEGAKDSGYMKSGKGSYSDGPTSPGVKNYDSKFPNGIEGGRDWFEGTKGNKGYPEPS